MQRRTVLKGVAGLAAASGWTGSVRAQPSSILKFIPGSSLTILDPLANTTAPTRTHGFMVFDTLYGLDAAGNPQPQMVDGHSVEDGGLTWTLRLREGLQFHDGTPVLARDVVASLTRWAKRDVLGGLLMAATQELSASSDRDIRFRLRKPFPLLPAALGKNGAYTPVIMPERLASGDVSKPVTEMVGSGPFRFLAAEFVPGTSAAYARFTGYVPRPSGPPGPSSAPKQVFFDRVEWKTIPDPSTAMAAMQTGEMDWWELPVVDMLPALTRDPQLQTVESSPQAEFLRFNCLTPPFDNVAIRRLVLQCIDQKDMITAIAGTAEEKDRLAIFAGGPMQTTAGFAQAMPARTDFANVRQELKAAGYRGEPVVMLVGTDSMPNAAASAVGQQLFQKMGLTVDYQALDWATVSQRRTSMQPIDKGGWSCFFVAGDADYFVDPASNFFVRGNGAKAWYGWPTSARLEELCQSWYDAPDLAAQKAVAAQIQLQAWQDVPYVPCALFPQTGIAKRNLTGFPSGFTKFYNVRRI